MKKFKKSRLLIDKELYNAAQYKAYNLIFNKKKNYFENKLYEYIGKPKELWKDLKSLGLPNKISSCEVSAVKVNKTVQHDTNWFQVDSKILTTCDNVFNKKYLLDNYNNLRYNKNSVCGTESKEF